MRETTREMAARLRRQSAQSLRNYLDWGLTEEEKARFAQEDAEYFAQRRAELEGPAAEGDLLLKADRIEERMRQRDDAHVPASRFYQGK